MTPRCRHAVTSSTIVRRDADDCELTLRGVRFPSRAAAQAFVESVAQSGAGRVRASIDGRRFAAV